MSQLTRNQSFLSTATATSTTAAAATTATTATTAATTTTAAAAIDTATTTTPAMAALAQRFSKSASLALQLFPALVGVGNLYFPDDATSGSLTATTTTSSSSSVQVATNSNDKRTTKQIHAPQHDPEHTHSKASSSAKPLEAFVSTAEPGEILIPQAPRRLSRQQIRAARSNRTGATTPQSSLHTTAIGLGHPVRTHQVDRPILASLATLRGPKDKRLFAVLSEHSLECFKSPSKQHPLNLVLPLAKHAFGPVQLGRCSSARREVTLCLSRRATAKEAVRQLQSSLSANFPIVLRFGTQREFEKWFAELSRRMLADFSQEPPQYIMTSRMQKRQTVSAALSGLVFWYYCEGGDRTTVTGPCKAAHLVSKFPGGLSQKIDVAPAFHYNDFRCTNLWFKSIAEWWRRLHTPKLPSNRPPSSVNARPGPPPPATASVAAVFNASKAELRRLLAADGFLHVGWGNGLPVAFIEGICSFLPTPDLFQVAYMCSRRFDWSHSKESIVTCGALWSSAAYATLFFRLLYPKLPQPPTSAGGSNATHPTASAPSPLDGDVIPVQAHLAWRQAKRNLRGLARRIAVVGASIALRRGCSPVHGGSTGRENLFEGGDHVLESQFCARGNPLFLREAEPRIWDRPDRGMAGRATEAAEEAEENLLAEMLLRHIGVQGFSLSDSDARDCQDRGPCGAEFALAEVKSEYELTLRRWMAWGREKLDFGGRALRRYQRVSLRWPSKWMDALFALDAIRKVYNSRSMRSPTPLFKVSVYIPWADGEKKHGVDGSTESGVVTVDVDTINISVRDFVQDLNNAIQAAPRLAQLRSAGAMEAVNVDLLAGGFHVLKMCGVCDYLVHVDRPLVSFQEVFTPLMMYLGNENDYNGHLLVPRLEVVSITSEEREQLTWLLENRDVYRQTSAAIIDEKPCGGLVHCPDDAGELLAAANLYRSRAIPKWLVMGAAGSDQSPVESPRPSVHNRLPTADVDSSNIVLTSDDELPDTDTDSDQDAALVAFDEARNLVSSIVNQGSLNAPVKIKLRAQDVDARFSLHVGQCEVAVEVDVLLGEVHASLQQVRRTRSSLRVVEMLPKEISLLLCLEHNNVPLRYRANESDCRLVLAFRLDFSAVENDFSEAVYTLDIGNSAKNPNVFFDVPVSELPAETVISGYFMLDTVVDLASFRSPMSSSFMYFRLPVYDHTSRLVTLREMHAPLYMCLSKHNLKKSAKRVQSYKFVVSDDMPTQHITTSASPRSSGGPEFDVRPEITRRVRSMRSTASPFLSPHNTALSGAKPSEVQITQSAFSDSSGGSSSDVEPADNVVGRTSAIGRFNSSTDIHNGEASMASPLTCSRRDRHRWSLPSDASLAFSWTSNPLSAGRAIGDAAITICLGRVESREIFTSRHAAEDVHGSGDANGFVSPTRRAIDTNPDQVAYVINTPVHLGECVLFSLACPAAPHSAGRADLKAQLKYCLAMSRLVKEHPVEFQRLHQNRDVVLDGTKSSDGESTTVWQHAEFAWRCRDLLLEFARLSDAYMDALDSVRHEDKAANNARGSARKESMKKIATDMARKLSISGAVRKFGHFEEGSKKEKLKAQEENLWNLLPVIATFVSFTDPAEVCSLWRLYSVIVIEYLESAACPENFDMVTPASTSSNRATGVASENRPSHRSHHLPRSVFGSDVDIEVPNQSLCYQHVRDLAEEFLGSQHFADRGLQSRAFVDALNAPGMHGATFRPPVRVPMNIVLALLDQCPSDTVTRKFAIFCLGTMSDFRLLQYLPQLLNNLKAEQHLDNPLARFLLRRAIASPATIGHHMFWHLVSELDAPHQVHVDAQYRALLWYYVTQAKPHARYLATQCSVTTTLMSIGEVMRYLKGGKHADTGTRDWSFLRAFETGGGDDELTLDEEVARSADGSMRHGSGDFGSAGDRGSAGVAKKQTKSAAKDARLNFLRCLLRLTSIALPNDAEGPFTLPINHHNQVSGILAAKSRVMSSKQAPLWMVFQNGDGPHAPNWTMLCKQGDDIRQDHLTLQALKQMQFLWWQHGINLKLSIYDVAATGYMSGFIQIVPSSTTIGAIHATAGGTSTDNTVIKYLKGVTAAHASGISAEAAELDKRPLKSGLKSVDDFMLDNFVRTCAGYCAATYCIGIGDRHPSNVMITTTGHLFHIDFGHFLGNWKKKMGVKRETTKVTFYASLMKVVAEQHLKDLFQRMCSRSFQVLRIHSCLLHQLFVGCIPAGMPELTDVEDAQYLADHLHVSLSDKEASKLLLGEINKAVADVMRKIDNMFHHFVHYRKKS